MKEITLDASLDLTPIVFTLGMSLADMEKRVVLRAFFLYRENKTATANALGISIRTLDKKLELYEQQHREARARRAEQQRAGEEYLARCRGEAPIEPAKTPTKESA